MAGRPKVRAERLDESSIVNAALKIARDQLDNLTMRSVADELQVSVGALYKHVAGRDELIGLVVEKILSQAPPCPPRSGTDGWPCGLRCWAYRRWSTCTRVWITQ